MPASLCQSRTVRQGTFEFCGYSAAIRRAPTGGGLLEREELNPRGRAEWRALEEERRFLSGTLDVPDPLPGHPH